MGLEHALTTVTCQDALAPDTRGGAESRLPVPRDTAADPPEARRPSCGQAPVNHRAYVHTRLAPKSLLVRDTSTGTSGGGAKFPSTPGSAIPSASPMPSTIRRSHTRLPERAHYQLGSSARPRVHRNRWGLNLAWARWGSITGHFVRLAACATPSNHLGLATRQPPPALAATRRYFRGQFCADAHYSSAAQAFTLTATGVVATSIPTRPRR